LTKIESLREEIFEIQRRLSKSPDVGISEDFPEIPSHPINNIDSLKEFEAWAVENKSILVT